jgi:hypothetical protein
MEKSSVGHGMNILFFDGTIDQFNDLKTDRFE